jgi:hypothetical protein
MPEEHGWPNWHEMSTSIRKPRSDSKLQALDLDEQRQLCEWMLAGLSYEKIKFMVLEKFGVSTNAMSLSRFYQSYVSAYVIQRRSEAVGVAKEIGDELKRRPGEFSQVTIDALEQKAFELANSPMVNSKSLTSVFTVLLRARDQSLKEKDIELKLRRLQLLEENSSAAKEKLNRLARKGAGLSKETLTQIEQALKLL